MGQVGAEASAVLSLSHSSADSPALSQCLLTGRCFIMRVMWLARSWLIAGQLGIWASLTFTNGTARKEDHEARPVKLTIPLKYPYGSQKLDPWRTVAHC